VIILYYIFNQPVFDSLSQLSFNNILNILKIYIITDKDGKATISCQYKCYSIINVSRYKKESISLSILTHHGIDAALV
jgi:hypothetical protein